MGNKLTDAQKDATPCPDCDMDPNDPSLHLSSCRRVAMGMPPDKGGPPAGTPDLQCGPPWLDWPEGIEPVNPIASQH